MYVVICYPRIALAAGDNWPSYFLTGTCEAQPRMYIGPWTMDREYIPPVVR